MENSAERIELMCEELLRQALERHKYDCREALKEMCFMEAVRNVNEELARSSAKKRE